MDCSGVLAAMIGLSALKSTQEGEVGTLMCSVFMSSLDFGLDTAVAFRFLDSTTGESFGIAMISFLAIAMALNTALFSWLLLMIKGHHCDDVVVLFLLIGAPFAAIAIVPYFTKNLLQHLATKLGPFVAAAVFPLVIIFASFSALVCITSAPALWCLYKVSGPSKDHINGVYDPTDELLDGRVVYKKVSGGHASDMWIEYHGVWIVKDTASRGRYTGFMKDTAACESAMVVQNVPEWQCVDSEGRWSSVPQVSVQPACTLGNEEFIANVLTFFSLVEDIPCFVVQLVWVTSIDSGAAYVLAIVSLIFSGYRMVVDSLYRLLKYGILKPGQVPPAEARSDSPQVGARL